MFKRISRRVSAVLMASAVVISQVLMPVQQAFADTATVQTSQTLQDTATPTVSGDWINNCSTISVTSSGYDASYKVYVRWYASAAHATAGVDGQTYAQINQTWTKTVDSQQVRGFSYRIVDATGKYVTPLLDKAASCVVVLSPWVNMTKISCDTVQVTGGNFGTYYQSVVKIYDEKGALVKEVLAYHNGVHLNDNYVSQTATLTTGHTYTAKLFLFDESTNKSYDLATSSGPIDMTADCPSYTPNWLNCRAFELAWKNLPDGATIRIIWKDASGKWLGYSDKTETSNTWGKYDMPLDAASVQYIVTDSAGTVLAQQTSENKTPCSSKAQWDSCNSFGVNTVNYPAGYKVQVNWQQHGQSQYTTVPVETTNATGWWSGPGRESVGEFSYTIFDATGKAVFLSDKIVKTTKCTVTPTTPVVDKNCTISIPENTDGITYELVYVDVNSNIVAESSNDIAGAAVLATAKDGYILDVNGQLVSEHLFMLDFSNAQCGTGGTDEPVTPITPTPSNSGELPKTMTSAAGLPLPAELPHTGSSWNGLIIALVAAISTYGAVFFAQGKREL